MDIIDEDQDDQEHQHDDDLPCRTLDQFCLYDIMHENEIVGMDDIGADGMEVRASGIVKPYFEDGTNGKDDDVEDEEDENMVQRVKITSIFYWEIQMKPCGKRYILINLN